MKNTALVHDWLFQIGGAEKVLEEIYSLFPGDLFTLFKDKNFPLLKGANVQASFLNSLPFAKKIYRHLLPLYPALIESFDLSSYDLILSSSHAVASKVLTTQEQLHICYCHTPMRYIWDLCFDYFKVSSFSPLQLYTRHVLHKLRNWDASSHLRVDHFIANSHFVKRRIAKIYGRDSTVIYPPVDVDRFTFHEKKEDYYLTVCRLVSYKKVDLIIDCFNALKNKKLIIIGDGPLLEEYKRRAGPNIILLGPSSDATVLEYMQNARAFVYAAMEDFGISPVEAMAVGTPVIAFGKGGTKETVIPGKTGVYFEKQEKKELTEAILAFNALTFDPYFIREHAMQYSKKRFKQEYFSFVETKWEEHRKKML